MFEEGARNGLTEVWSVMECIAFGYSFLHKVR